MGIPKEGVLTLTPPVFDKRRLLADTDQPKQGIYEESATQKHHVGTKLIYPDGRVFRYAKNGAVALSKSLMTCGATIQTQANNEAQATSGTSQEIGDLEVTVDVTTGGTWVENAYAEGFLYVNDGTGEGDIYKIVANKINASDDTLLTVQLETPLRTAWAAGTEVTLVKSNWQDIVVLPTTATLPPAGVPLIDVTANYYCWVQTGGYCPIIVDASDTIVAGEPAGKPGTDGAAGTIGLVANDGTDAVWGIVVYESTAGEKALIDLKLES